jgi:putative membrane protein
MIRHYSDHAANERTFLAWVRTAIATMALGFVIERFDLFLQSAMSGPTSRMFSPDGQRLASASGLAFFFVGVATIAIATVRFVRTGRAIDRDDSMSSIGSWLDFALSFLLVLLGIVLFLYLERAVVLSL